MPIEIPKGLPFSVDTWSPSSKIKRYHFLTHAHRDHCQQICQHSTYPIYATHLTKVLVLQQYPQLEESLFVEIEIGQTVDIEDPDSAFCVTAFDANHCPGAVMFLFEGEFGNILHTGDCRFTLECLLTLPPKYLSKKDKEPNCRLDYLFLDCTFANCPLNFPSKHSAIRQVVNCIWKHPDAPIVYLACDQLGQEDILTEVSRTFGSKIFLDRDKNEEYFHTLSLVNPCLLSNDPFSRFQIFEGYPKFCERASRLLMEAQGNSQLKPIIIRPSAQWYACDENLGSQKQAKKRLNEAEKDQYGIWHVCYSMHSSKAELEWALELLKPKRVVSTTPSRGTELEYVKRTCTSIQILPTDPLWKLLNIDPSNALSLRDSSLDCTEACQVIESNQTSLEPSSESNKLHASLLPKERPLTLFGPARFGVLASDPLAKKAESKTLFYERCFSYIPMKNNQVDKAESQESANSAMVGKNADFEEIEAHPVEFSLSHVASEDVRVQGNNSKEENSISSSLKRWYRSMNVPIPRPLPPLRFSTRKRTRVSYSYHLLYSSVSSSECKSSLIK